MNATASKIEINEEDQLRADMYNFLGPASVWPAQQGTLWRRPRR